jgi:hypothetical protein
MYQNEGVKAQCGKPMRNFKSLFSYDELCVTSARQYQHRPAIGAFRDKTEATRPMHGANHQIGKRSGYILYVERRVRPAEFIFSGGVP